MKVNGVGAVHEQINDIQRYGFGPSFTLWLLTMVGYRKVTGDDYEVKKRGLMDKVRGVRDGLSDDSDRIPPQYKDTAHNHLNRGKQFLTEEYFPEERRDQFIYRGKKVL
jgi:hypothetical protein